MTFGSREVILLNQTAMTETRKKDAHAGELVRSGLGTVRRHDSVRSSLDRTGNRVHVFTLCGGFSAFIISRVCALVTSRQALRRLVWVVVSTSAGRVEAAQQREETPSIHDVSAEELQRASFYQA